MKHYSDPRTDEELRLSYKETAGTFKHEQGFTFVIQTYVRLWQNGPQGQVPSRLSFALICKFPMKWKTCYVVP